MQGQSKLLTIAIAFVLILFWFALTFTEPEAQSEVPVIYWVIDPAPVRQDQIALFHTWLIKYGHGEEYQISNLAELRSFCRKEWTPAIKEAIINGNPDGKKIWDDNTSAVDLPIRVVVPGAKCAWMPPAMI